ncbi:MAG: glycoside hydrolase family 3 N-terminal domain-containing protein [Ferruginibacter sp.]
MRRFVMFVFLLFSLRSIAQQDSSTRNKMAFLWADSVLQTLSSQERIAQLMIIRLSSMDPKTKVVTFYDDSVSALIKRYNIGGICLFQGGPVTQANLINSFQTMARTPLLICIDAEWGMGMRILDTVATLPKQMMLGAMKDSSIVYKYGQAVAEQCKRMGIQVNYAPVVDVNNNPNNPVINDRSFGEDKYKVARFGIQYMKGMQDMGVMACAKHFPGHGDVAVDSHYDLPVINKSRAQLDSLELYPFRKIFEQGIASTMIAHLYIPSIDSRPNRATSISRSNVTDLLRDQLHYNGLTFTDALDMKGVTKFFPNGEASVEALIAGNDMLCLPENISMAIAKVTAAIENKKLSSNDIDMHCRKVLIAKYLFGCSDLKPINTEGLSADLNKNVPAMTKLIAENAITLLSNKNPVFFPLIKTKKREIAYVAVGINTDNTFASAMRRDYNAVVYYFDYNKKDQEEIDQLVKKISKYKKVVIGVHNLTRIPATNFGISQQANSFVKQLQHKTKSITFLFGNAYAVKNWCNASNLVLCYEDDPVIQNTAVNMLAGHFPYKGVLPVTVCPKYRFGFGLMSR